MLSRPDIEKALDYMDSKGLIRLARQSTNGSKWRQLYCPFHSGGQEKRPSCGCSLESEIRNGQEYHAGTFHCFACGTTYSFSKGILEILALKDSSLVAHPDLEKYVNDLEISDTNSLIPNDMMSSILAKYAADDLRLRLGLRKEFIPESELAKYRFTVPYMYQRRLTDPIIDKYDVGYDAHHVPAGRKKELPCITFPIRDINGNTVSICRRSIEGKYFNMPTGVDKPIYGIYELPKDAKEVIICESIFNALTCVVYGHPALALLGTGSGPQINTLKRLGIPNYILCLDNDEAGNKGADKLKKALKNTSIVWTMHVPVGKDANDLSYEEFEQVYKMRD